MKDEMCGSRNIAAAAGAFPVLSLLTGALWLAAAGPCAGQTVRVLIYNGDDALADCVAATAARLDEASEAGTIPGVDFAYDFAADVNASSLAGHDVLVMPGGRGGRYYLDNPRIEGEAIRSFLSAGGGYFGTCAGAYAAVSRVHGYYDGWALAPHVTANAVSFIGPLPVTMVAPGEAVFGLSGTLSMYHWNGPAMEAAAGSVVLGQYADGSTGYPPGYAALVADFLGDGRTILSGPHPELDPVPPGMAARAVAWAAGLVEGLDCAEGQEETRPCCDCGTQSRTCGSRTWGEWSACSGPDPGEGHEPCDTGDPPPCDAGELRCIEGCLACVSLVPPVEETCDGRDNDCDGEVDEGEPQTMGDPPPAHAALLTELEYPGSVEEGRSASVRAVFMNVGTESWLSDGLRLVPASCIQGHASPLHDPESWPAWNEAAVLHEDIPARGEAVFEFSVLPDFDAVDTIAETFRLALSDGTLVACPSPSARVFFFPTGDEGFEAVAEGAELTGGSCGCSLLPVRSLPGKRGTEVLLLFLLLLASRSGRHRARSRPSCRGG